MKLPRLLAALLVLGPVLVLACVREVIVPAPPAPALDAAVTTEASAPAATDAATVAPEASAQVPSAAAPSSPPPYQPDWWRAKLPSGSVDLPTPDGGMVRIHDGNENPCVLGCVTFYGQMGRAESLAFDGGVPGARDLVRDQLACVRACPKSLSWPGTER